MTSLLRQLCVNSNPGVVSRAFSVTASSNKNYGCKLLVIGGGSGGCTIAAKMAKKLPKNSIVILEPSEDHYYQPLWTLVGAGATTLRETRRATEDVLPKAATWVRDHVCCIDPDNCYVTTSNGDTIQYEYVVVAAGLKNDYHKIPGLEDTLDDPESGVSTIYSAQYCTKTWNDLRRFKGGQAVFTYPNTPIKCPGAPQKIAYLADSLFTQKGIRENATITYNTCLPVIFGVKKYADALLKVVERKKIKVNFCTVLKEIKPDSKQAVFYNAEKPYKEFTMQYDLLHVAPPMSTPEFLSSNERLVDKMGFLDVDKYSLRHTKYENIYGLGDCTNTPNSKTAAAVAKQSYVVAHNLWSSMLRPGTSPLSYNGYGACPLVTSYNTCILAEFLYDGKVHETFPFNQAKERRISYYMKKDLFPFIYWHFMLKGNYNGPEFVRKIVNPMGW